MVAGAAALVKQQHPGWQPWQIKSALMNTATQDVTDRGNPASIVAAGAGKLNTGNAVGATLTVDPQSASFGVAKSLPVSQTFRAKNNGTSAVDIQLASDRASVTIAPASLSIAPDQTATFTATLGGDLPGPCSYEGFLTLTTVASTLHIPYLYLVSDGIANNLIPLLGDAGVGLVNHDVPDGMLAFEVIDQYGLPVPNVPATFSVLLGGGNIRRADAVTNAYGIATAEAVLGPIQTTNIFTARAGNLSARFTNSALLQPNIADRGVVNSASFQTGAGIAPGSYVSIFGQNLSTSNGSTSSSRLPLAIRNVSVSFDVPEAGISAPGHLIYISPGQVNVQVPWELAGQKSVRMKVSISSASGVVYTVPVSDASPGLFPLPASQAAVGPGQTVSFYGTGFGPVNSRPASGEPAADASSTTIITPTVTIGGIPAQVQFSGLAPGYAGLYQINVTVPAGAGSGSQEVAMSVNGVASNIVQLPVQ
jgi:uncharacterized protein (TIGR03437 family)